MFLGILLAWIIGIGLALVLLDYLIVSIAYPLKATTAESPQLMMILGCPATNQGQPSAIMQTRLDQAVKLWHTGHYCQILVSGGAVANQYQEAQIMARVLIGVGVPTKQILIENQSTNTFLNFKNSLRLINQRPVMLVTSSWHARKAAYYARRLGVKFQVSKAADVPHHWWWLHLHQYPRYYFKMSYQLLQLPFWHEF